MAQTKQTPKNPHVSQPKTVIGSDVLPKRKTTPKPTSSKAPVKGGKQPRKHLSWKLLQLRYHPYWRNQEAASL